MSLQLDAKPFKCKDCVCFVYPSTLWRPLLLDGLKYWLKKWKLGTAYGGSAIWVETERIIARQAKGGCRGGMFPVEERGVFPTGLEVGKKCTGQGSTGLLFNPQFPHLSGRTKTIPSSEL